MGNGSGHHKQISIHALREEGDASSGISRRQQAHFYPRPPRGGRHYTEWYKSKGGKISIHALREEGDN